MNGVQMDNNKKGIGDNSYRYEDRYEGMLDQAVRFLAKLSNLVISAEAKLRTKAINGRNVVVRARGLDDASADLKILVKETKSWHEVIETMKRGKDVHIQENCKSEKLDIVGGSAYDFGQYLIDRSDGKFCEQNPDLDNAIDGIRGNISGKAYIEKVTGHGN